MSQQTQLEVMWAMKAYNHAEVYFNVSAGMIRITLPEPLACPALPTIYFFLLQLISAVDPKFLKLTKSDDQIYTKFREAFPDFSIQVLDPELLKSAEAKEVRKVPTYVRRYCPHTIIQVFARLFYRHGGLFVTSSMAS